jgi:hypothetical protein
MGCTFSKPNNPSQDVVGGAPAPAPAPQPPRPRIPSQAPPVVMPTAPPLASEHSSTSLSRSRSRTKSTIQQSRQSHSTDSIDSPIGSRARVQSAPQQVAPVRRRTSSSSQDALSRNRAQTLTSGEGSRLVPRPTTPGE